MDKIAVIDGNPKTRMMVRLALKKAGFVSVCESGNGAEGLALVLWEKPALVVLGLMLSGMDGFAVCSAVRRTPSVAGTPIIMLTARSAEEDVVRGFELGVDDYVTKPFSAAILAARVKAVLRRTSPPRGPVHTFGAFMLDEVSRSVSLDGVMLSLTRSEFDLLAILVAHPGRVYSRQQIMDRIQREEKNVTDRAIDTLMVGVRRKLGAWAGHVKTVRGVGYRIAP